MSRLKVLLRGAQISDLNLSSDREYIGGRKESCDIRLQPEKGISREHFKLKFEEGRWVLTSMSRFGEIFSLGQRVESIPLEHGQVFQVPPYEFIYSEIPDSATDDSKIEAPVVGENESTVIGVAQQVPYFKMMGADGQVREMLRLEVGDVWAAGRDPSCQIIIPDQRVSRRQFEIRKINGTYTIIDLGSVNGTFLNGSPVSSTDPQSLKSGDAVTVLDNTMYFELHDPNFQYRMERIEVPPLQMQNAVEEIPEIASEEAVPEQAYEQANEQAYDQNREMNYPEEVQQQEYYQEQIQPDGSPFTGMPIDQGPNNFYNFQPGMDAAAQPPPMPPANAWEKLKNNKPVFISVILLIFIGLYLVSEISNPPSTPAQKSQEVAGDDPISRLQPEERENIEMWYKDTERELRQQKFTEAKEKLDKIHKLLPLGYKDSKLYENEALNGEQTMLAQMDAQEQEKKRLEAEATLKATIEKCRADITPDTTLDGIQLCLAPAKEIDPSNAEVESLIEQVRKTISDREAKAENERQAKAQQEELQQIFDRAEKVHEAGFPKKAMKAYQEVVDSPLNDPEDLKGLSAKRIKLIEKKLNQRNSNNINNAEVYLKEGKLKEGILALQAALQYDPDNKIIKEKIEKYSNDLRNQVKVMYQESIIDENFGYVDGVESRPGAKDKWKKIIELDLEDGDYYRKAYIKLKRYGVF